MTNRYISGTQSFYRNLPIHHKPALNRFMIEFEERLTDYI